MTFTALQKLEKVAIRYSDKKGKPLVLVINNIHLFSNDADGQHIVLQFQQRVEAWATSGEHILDARETFNASTHDNMAGIVTVVFSS